MCRKCYEFKKFKEPQIRTTPSFAKPLREAHQIHNKICKEWRKAGRPQSDVHPAKMAKKESQRNLQKITRQKESGKAISLHDYLMMTHRDNISEVCQKQKR